MTEPSLPHPRKVRITQVGQPCRHCATPVVERIRREPPRHGKECYWYCRILRCPSCRAIYLLDEDRRPYSNDAAPAAPIVPDPIKEAIARDARILARYERKHHLKTQAKEAKRRRKAERREARKGKSKKPTRLQLYEAYINSPEWRKRRAAIIEKRGRKCEECGDIGPVDAHHLTYERLGKELDEDVKLLCRECHQAHHRHRKMGKVDKMPPPDAVSMFLG